MKTSALFIMHFPPPVYGATVVNQFIRTNARVNAEYDIEYVNLATNDKVDAVGKFKFRKITSFLKIIWNILSACRKKKYQVTLITLTASGPAFLKDLIVVAILKIYRSNIVYYFHNKGVEAASRNPVMRLLYKFAFKNCKVILLSKYLYPDVKSFVREEDVYFCPIGIPELPISSTRENGLTVGPTKLLYLSNMMVEKGVLVLLDACKILKDKNLPFTCDFVGAWTDVTEVEFKNSVDNLGLTDSVFWHGPKYGSEKSDFFARADIFVFPTYYHFEASPLVNLEAMQYRLPIVACPEGGVPDAVHDGINGFLTPQRDSKVLSSKLADLIQNPQLRTEMGNRGRTIYDDTFTISHFEKRFLTIIGQAAN